MVSKKICLSPLLSLLNNAFVLYPQQLHGMTSSFPQYDPACQVNPSCCIADWSVVPPRVQSSYSSVVAASKVVQLRRKYAIFPWSMSLYKLTCRFWGSCPTSLHAWKKNISVFLDWCFRSHQNFRCMEINNTLLHTDKDHTMRGVEGKKKKKSPCF